MMMRSGRKPGKTADQGSVLAVSKISFLKQVLHLECIVPLVVKMSDRHLIDYNMITQSPGQQKMYVPSNTVRNVKVKVKNTLIS